MVHDFRVAVVIPTFNRAALVCHTLECVLRQTQPAAEIVVVDDGSTDDTETVLKAYSAKIKTIHIEQCGVQVARNVGIEATCAPWIALCDSDDLWDETYLQKAAALASAAPELDFIFSNSRQFSNEGWATRTKFDLAPEDFWNRIRCIERPEGIEFLKSLVPHAFFCYHPILPSGAIFSRVLFEKIGPFDARLRGIKSEDGEFVVRCLYSGRVGALREPLVGVRRHSGNSTADKAITGRGEARVMKFGLEHHPQAAMYAEQLQQEIAKRNAGALDAAFAAGYFEIVREAWEELPQHQRTLAASHKVCGRTASEFHITTGLLCAAACLSIS